METRKKKKHVSKKNKKDWRKHCDVTDVEKFLEDQRLDERLGKFDTKPDSEIFVIDTGADEAKTVDKPLTAKGRKRAALSSTPKCFEILIPSSKVQDPNAKRNKVNPAGTKPTALSRISINKKEKKGVFAKKQEVAKKNRQLALEKKRKNKSIRQTFNINLWGDDVPEEKTIPSTLTEELPKEAQLHNVSTTRRLRPKPPLAETVKTRAAIELPHPGVSYNPSFKEHQELLKEVVDYEKVMMKRESHLMRVTSGMFRKVTPKEMQNQYLKEMDTDKVKAEQSDQSDGEYKAINPPVKNKKKDHKARRKQKERLAEIERLKRLKVDRKKISDIYRLRTIKSKIIEKEEKDAEIRVKKRSKLAEQAKTSLPSLSGHKTPKKEPDYVPANELTGDLRCLNNTTNLLRERYESLQRRGAIAASKVMMKKKRNLRSYFKPGHKVTDNDVNKFVEKVAKGAKTMKG